MKTEVSKSSDGGGLIVGIDTIRAPRAEPPPTPTLLPPRVALTMRGFRDLDTADEKPRVEGATWVLDADDDEGGAVERAGEKEEVAAAIFIDLNN